MPNVLQTSANYRAPLHQPLTLRADSLEEAAAFAAATLLEHPELADQALVGIEIAGSRLAD